MRPAEAVKGDDSLTWHLVSDSACDLYTLDGGEGKMDFATIPFSIRIGGKEYIDDENMPIDEMLEANETHAEMAQTACPSPEAWREKFSAPGPVIAFTISGALSGSYNSACTGRNMLLEEEPDKQIAIIDSHATGPEQTMLVWRARDLILEGKTFDEIEKDLNETAKRIHTSFAIASYHNLIKSGRVSRLIGFIAGHLGFWGIGIGDEKGEIAIRGKARGSKSMIRFLTEEIEKVGIAGKQIVISHCRNIKDALALKAALEALRPGIEVLVQQARGLDSFYAERSGLIVGY